MGAQPPAPVPVQLASLIAAPCLRHDDLDVHANTPGEHSSSKWYLMHFVHKYLDYRHAEVESVAGMLGWGDHLRWRVPDSPKPLMVPFWYASLPNDEAVQQVVSRTLLTRRAYEVWGEGSSWEELEASVRAYPDHLKEPWLAAGTTFKVYVSAYGNTVGMQQQREYMQRLTYVNFKGKVDLKNAQVKFWLIVVDISDTTGLGNREEVPFRIIFGREVAEYNHSIVDHYRLTARPYIGPTSMDAEMAFIMCNQAQVSPGHLVFDPYVGTGSITVAAAHYGAYVMGGDIDVRVVKWGKASERGPRLDVMTNFRHYGLAGRMAGLLAMDMHTHPLRDNGLEGIFHSIIGDPPYGVRAGGKKLVAKEVNITDRASHISSTDAYNLGECLRDLLDFAARTLRLGGRLVFFMPATIETYSEEELPAHPMLRLVYNCEQMLHTRYSRRLITMEKAAAYDTQAAAAFHAQKPDPTMAIDRLHDLVYEAYQRDERGKIIYPEAMQAQFQERKFRGKKL